MSGAEQSRAAETGALLAAIADWSRALCRGDADGIDRLLAETVSYGHSTGAVHDREEYRAFLASGPAYLSVEIENPDLRIAGSAAIVTGRLVQSLIRRGEETPVAIHARVLQVWVRSDGGWRLTAAQSTREPAS